MSEIAGGSKSPKASRTNKLIAAALIALTVVCAPILAAATWVAIRAIAAIFYGTPSPDTFECEKRIGNSMFGCPPDTPVWGEALAWGAVVLITIAAVFAVASFWHLYRRA